MWNLQSFKDMCTMLFSLISVSWQWCTQRTATFIGISSFRWQHHTYMNTVTSVWNKPILTGISIFICAGSSFMHLKKKKKKKKKASKLTPPVPLFFLFSSVIYTYKKLMILNLRQSAKMIFLQSNFVFRNARFCFLSLKRPGLESINL